MLFRSNDTATTEIYTSPHTLSLHDALPILGHKTANHHVDDREKLAAVTEQHYNRSQKISLKAEGMALWVKALMSAYEKERKKFRFCRAAPWQLAA